MRNRILIIGAIAFAAYVLGSRAAKFQIDRGESVVHQLVRLWNDPKAKKEREKAAKKLKKAAEKSAKKVQKAWS